MWSGKVRSKRQVKDRPDWSSSSLLLRFSYSAIVRLSSLVAKTTSSPSVVVRRSVNPIVKCVGDLRFFINGVSLHSKL